MKKVALPVMACILGIVLTHVCWTRHLTAVYEDLSLYVDGVYALQRKIIEGVPIYDDFVKPGFESELRTYLFPRHIQAARTLGVGPVADMDQCNHLVEKGALVSIDGEDLPYYFYGVKKEHRYLTPGAARGLAIIASTFREVQKAHGIKAPIKFALSSALRPASYQGQLRGTNMNAVAESTHSYGVSVDLFFDDYYVVFPQVEGGGVLANIVSRVRSRLGYLAGDALRRQGKTLLAMTVHRLQKEGVIYATLERNQRCFHITVVKPENPVK